MFKIHLSYDGKMTTNVNCKYYMAKGNSKKKFYKINEADLYTSAVLEALVLDAFSVAFWKLSSRQAVVKCKKKMHEKSIKYADVHNVAS